MIYLDSNFQITNDTNALYQVNIPRVKHAIPAFFVNKGDKPACKTDVDKIIKTLRANQLL